jgi:hypothetical protein
MFIVIITLWCQLYMSVTQNECDDVMPRVAVEVFNNFVSVYVSLRFVFIKNCVMQLTLMPFGLDFYSF